jgi:hypothetical protein
MAGFAPTVGRRSAFSRPAKAVMAGFALAVEPPLGL